MRSFIKNTACTRSTSPAMKGVFLKGGLAVMIVVETYLSRIVMKGKRILGDDEKGYSLEVSGQKGIKPVFSLVFEGC